MSFTDEEACLYADIHPATLYRYIERNPKFGERKEILKKSPSLQAKKNWVEEIKASNFNASKDWLERKNRSEFSTRQEVDQTSMTLNLNKDITDLSDEELDKLIKGEE